MKDYLQLGACYGFWTAPDRSQIQNNSVFDDLFLLQDINFVFYDSKQDMHSSFHFTHARAVNPHDNDWCKHHKLVMILRILAFLHKQDQTMCDPMYDQFLLNINTDGRRLGVLTTSEQTMLALHLKMDQVKPHRF